MQVDLPQNPDGTWSYISSLVRPMGETLSTGKAS
jgi:hypothetical protein